MRALLALVLLSALPIACTPYIPIKDDFGTSALAPPAPPGDIPPEFAEFNQYDPAVNTLLSTQMCATPYQVMEDKTLGAVPGVIVNQRGRCQTHVPLFGIPPLAALGLAP